MALLKGEGTHQILYGSADIFSGIRHNRGYLCRPDHAGTFPSVLLVHGAPGLTSSVKSAARRLARYGLAVVAPDLYRGRRQLRRPLPPWPGGRELEADVTDALEWMNSSDTPWIRPGPVGALSLDRGADPALAAAARHDDIGCVALVSPITVAPMPQADVPIIGFYGKDDEVVGGAEQTAVQRALNHAEWVLYGGVGHGLIDESAPDYRWDVAEDVLDRIVAFFREHLDT